MTLTKLTGANLIDGRESALGTESLFATERATGRRLEPDFLAATSEEIASACQAAKRAFPAFSNTGPEERARFLEAIAAQVVALGEPLLERILQETALPMQRLIGERERTCNQLRMFASLIREGSWVRATIETSDGERKPPKPDIRNMLVPIGPVAVYGASNFPLAFSVSGGDTASALAAGCPVVFKSNPGHLGTAELVGRAILTAAKATGMPEGVFALLHGGIPVAQELVMREEIVAVGFTGSRKAGRALFDLAASRESPIPVFAEMGSVNPVFILPNALALQRAKVASGYACSLMLGCGQFCTNPGVVIGIASTAFDEFLREVAARLGEGMGGVMLTQSIHDAFISGVDGRRKNRRLRPVFDGETCKGGVFPALHLTSAPDFLADPSLSEELFGPAAIAVQCSNFTEMAEVAEALEGQLTASIHGEPGDQEETSLLADILRNKAGRLLMNDFPTGVEVGRAMQHGGPYPATTDSRWTSVGTSAIYRFVRPVAWQNFEDGSLPDALRDRNPLGINRMVNGRYTDAPI